MSERERSVLCGANAYEEKYYFNEKEYGNLPEEIKKELQIICVLYTEEVGGSFMIVFEPDGSISMDISSDEQDYLYDQVSARLLLSKVRTRRQKLFTSLSLYYRAVILGEDIDAITSEEE